MSSRSLPAGHSAISLLPLLWQAASPAQRRLLAGTVVEGLYLDPDQTEEVLVHVKPDLRGLIGVLPPCIQRVTDGARIPIYYHTPTEAALLVA